MLDFINTVNARPTYSRDDLTSDHDVVRWAEAAGLRMRGGEAAACGQVTSNLHRAVMFREQLYGVFGPIAQGLEPRDSALSFVTRRGAQALRSARWSPGPPGFVPSWPVDSIEGICDHLADAAMQLLRSSATARIGSCAGCGWLYLDTSRAHARRWCSMNACGVRSKMRRYHQRQTSATGTL
ncbi:MAG: ABATE domain-containing protein [Ilumatobacteraceae bacterium]